MNDTVVPFEPKKAKKGKKNAGHGPQGEGMGAGGGHDGGPPEGLPPEGGEFDWKCAFHPRNDLGNARRLIDRHGADLMYGVNIGWLGWDDRRWSAELGETQSIVAAHDVAERVRDEAKALRGGVPPRWFTPDAWIEFVEKHQKWAVTAGNQRNAVNMLAAAEPYLQVHARDLDADQFLFNCQNGTLRLGGPRLNEYGATEIGVDFQEHERADLITHLAEVEYKPGAPCRVFETFLEEILPDAETRRFVQKALGYSLTGDASEQVIFIFYGSGANGKSALIDIISHLMGDYSVATGIQTFMFDPRRSGGQATPDLARLPGRRMVLASEPEQGMRFSESIVKIITGGDVMTARNLNEGFFEFKAVFKLFLLANMKPAIRGQDEGIWRRMRMVPFEQFIPPERRDRFLAQKLIATEASGILNWLLDGYRAWRIEGLIPPAAVRKATEEYRQESDPVGEFMAMATQRKVGATGDRGSGPYVNASKLYQVYCKWSGANGLRPFSGTAFGRRLGDLAYHKEKWGGFLHYIDLEITQDDFGGLEGSGGNDGDPRPAPPDAESDR